MKTFLTKADLERIDPRKKTSVLDYIPESFVHSVEVLYDSGKNREEISNILGLTEWQIRKALQYIRKTPSNIRRKFLNKLNTIPITEDQEQCILGTLLGDASLIKRIRYGTTTFEYTVGHCYAQLEYLQYIGDLLNKNIIKIKIKSGSKYTKEEFWHTVTYYNFYALEKLYSICYKNNQKYVSNAWINLLTPKALAYWYMDDGTSSYTMPRDKRYVICRLSTLSFSLEEIQLLQGKLLEYGIKTKLHYHSDGKHNIIAVKSRSINLFMDLIQPHIIPCMQYKIKRI